MQFQSKYVQLVFPTYGMQGIHSNVYKIISLQYNAINRHRRGRMNVLGNAAYNRPLTIGQTSLDTEQGSLPSLPPSVDEGHINQGSGW